MQSPTGTQVTEYKATDGSASGDHSVVNDPAENIPSMREKEVSEGKSSDAVSKPLSSSPKLNEEPTHIDVKEDYKLGKCGKELTL